MAVIDAQVHLWRNGTARPPRMPHPHLVEDALRGMDEAGVDGAMLHPPTSWDPQSNEQAINAALAHPKRFAVDRRRELIADRHRTVTPHEL